MAELTIMETIMLQNVAQTLEQIAEGATVGALGGYPKKIRALIDRLTSAPQQPANTATLPKGAPIEQWVNTPFGCYKPQQPAPPSTPEPRAEGEDGTPQGFDVGGPLWQLERFGRLFETGSIFDTRPSGKVIQSCGILTGPGSWVEEAKITCERLRAPAGQPTPSPLAADREALANWLNENVRDRLDDTAALETADALLSSGIVSPRPTEQQIRSAMCNEEATVKCEWPDCSCSGEFKRRLDRYTKAVLALSPARGKE